MILLESITSIIIFLVMVCMSAISTAYLCVDKDKLKIDKINDKKKEKRLKYILNNSSFFVTSVNSTISFLSLWLGALIVEILAAPIYNKFNVENSGIEYVLKYIIILVTVVIFTYFLYIFAEIIPKTYAIKNKDKIVQKNINVIYFISKIFSPFNKFLKFTEEIVMKIFKVNRIDKIKYEDSEVKELVDIAKEQGNLSPKENVVISNLLKLDETKAEDIMKDIEEVVLIDINASKTEIKETILNYGYTRIPVYDADKRNIVGIVNIKNVLKNMLKEKNIKKLVDEKYVKPCMKVSYGKRIDLLFNEMIKNKEHMAVVIKDDDIAIGIITMEDIIEYIVGDIEDDYEKYRKEELTF